MADEQDKWLNRETAERLLSGESLEAVDASAPDQVKRLAEALGALSLGTGPATAELPGEQGALAAFRKAREAADAERTAAGAGATGADRRSGLPARGADAGLVRIGSRTRSGIPGRAGTRARGGVSARRPGWARPVRLALAAAAAVGTLGGVAMAAQTGVLPTPFHKDQPRPAASVSTEPTPDNPLASASPQDTAGTGASGGGQSTGPGSDGSDEAGGPGGGKSGAPGAHHPATSGGTWWNSVAGACRDIRDGKDPGADRRRVLEGQAGGSSRVNQYCKTLLSGLSDSSAGSKGTGHSGGSGDSGDSGGSGKGGKGHTGKGGDKGKGDDPGQGGDEEGHSGGGRGHSGGGHSGSGHSGGGHSGDGRSKGGHTSGGHLSGGASGGGQAGGSHSSGGHAASDGRHGRTGAAASAPAPNPS